MGTIAAQSIGEPGTQLTMRNFHTGGVAGSDDITQGLPRVEEIFEARKPKGQCLIAKESGKVRFFETEDGKRGVRIVDPETDELKEEYVVQGAKLAVADGQLVEPGMEITEGSINPSELLAVCGARAVQLYMVKEVQNVYHSQGVDINAKHIEVMVRQMMKKVRVEDAGETNLLPGIHMDKFEFAAANEKAIAEGKKPATCSDVLLGITKASLATDSFLSAASFQETTRVLTRCWA